MYLVLYFSWLLLFVFLVFTRLRLGVVNGLRDTKQWRRRVPKSVWGGGTQTRNVCTFGKEPI